MKVKVRKGSNGSQNRWSNYTSVSPQKEKELDEVLKCRAKKGLKFSKKRAAIIEYFINVDRHYTVEQLYNEIKRTDSNISYSTVYRTLRLLVDCGMAAVHHFDEDETRFEPTHKEQHHDHLVCIKCGRIIEFTHDGIEKFQKDVARKHNFMVSNHELQIYGLCKKCQKKKVKNRRGNQYGSY